MNPSLMSFNWENLDVLLHPELYMLKSDKYDFPDFSHPTPLHEKHKSKPSLFP